MLKNILSSWLLVGLLFVALPSVAATTNEPQLHGLIGSLNTRSDNLNSQQQQQLYDESQVLLQETQEFLTITEQYRELIDNFKQERQSLTLQQQENIKPKFPSTDGLSRDQISSLLKQQQHQQQRLAEQIENLRTLQGSVEEDLSQHIPRRTPVQQQLELLEQQLSAIPELQLNEIDKAKRVKAQVQIAKFKAQLNMIDLAAQSAPNRSVLQQLELKNLEQQQKNKSQIIEAIQQQLAQRQRAEIDLLVSVEHHLGTALQARPEIQSLLQENQQLQQKVRQNIETSLAIQQQQQALNQQLQQIQHTFANFKEQVSWLNVTRSYGEYLREKIAQLPSPKALAPLEEEIVSIRVEKHRYQDQLFQLQSERWLNDLFPLSTKQQQQVAQFQLHHEHLLSEYLSELDSHLFELARLQLAYAKLNQTLNEIHHEASQELFWTPDVKRLDWSVFRSTQQALVWWLSPDNWRQLLDAFMQWPFWWYVGLALLALSYLHVRYLKRSWVPSYLQAIDAKTGNITRDKFHYTLVNLLLSSAIAAPLVLFIAAIGQAYNQSWDYPFAQHVGHALGRVAWVLACFHLLQAFALKNGLLNTHFKWPLINIIEVMKYLRRMVYFSLPLYFVFLVSLDQNSQANYESMARLCFIGLMLWLSHSMYRISRIELPVTYRIDFIKAPQLVRAMVWYSAIIIPLAAAIFACVGYLSTSFMLYRQLVVSVSIGASFLLVYLLIRRWMWLQRRRIAFERAKQRRIDMIAQRNQNSGIEEEQTSIEGVLEGLEDQEIDLDTISSQSLGLLRAVLLLTFVLTMLVTWSEMTSAFSFLDSIVLWEVNSSRAGIDVVDAITLRSLGTALLILSLTMLLVRNLPGLLELMLLQHLSLSPGTGFAITTIINYIMVVFGVVSSLGMLGIEWSKLQWLVAALTVGLGFGLQEIFANFISGLIILFERPIRIGDTVTIRELTGNISKIETRATTIMDWDRKEIIVPNKAFITEQFINWSLTDPITRVVLAVQVKQGANIEQVTDILSEAVAQTSAILDSPAAEIYFMGYTDNGAKFEMRVYVSEMRFRLPMTHELFSLINNKFNANNICIAYPQLDVSLNNK